MSDNLFSQLKIIITGRAPALILAGALACFWGGAPLRAAVAIDTLGSGVYNGRAFQKLKLTLNAFEPTYATWFPPAISSGVHGALVITEPYVGIDWTGDPRDTAFSTLPDAGAATLKEDVFGPDYIQGQSGDIVYNWQNDDAIASEAYAYLASGLGVLFVFERFYAGGDLVNDIQDTVTALQFLSEQPGVDQTRTGIYGGSLGGYCAVHGAVQAGSGAVPAFGVALWPPIDLSKLETYVTTEVNTLVSDPAKRALWALSLDPYVRRIHAIPGAPATYSAYSTDAVQAGLKTQFLLIHDPWDTLVPVQHSLGLLAAAPLMTEGYIVPRWGSIDYSEFDLSHSPVPFGGNVWYAWSMTHAYLLTRLLPQGVQFKSLFHSTELDAFIGFVHEAQRRGQNVESLAPRLLDLCDDRLMLIDVANLADPPVAGKTVVARWLNKYWNTSFSPDAVVEFLRNQGMPSAAGNPTILSGRSTAYPNPFRPALGHTFVSVVNLPASTPVRIVSLHGLTIREFITDGAGTFVWDTRNDAGEPVSSGVYLVTCDGMAKAVKIVVQR